IVRTFFSGKRTGGDFVTAVCSPRGELVHCIGEDRHLYSFDVATGHIKIGTDKLAETEIIGAAHHPFLNIMGVFAEDGLVRLY
ncbi:Serine/threonine-protein kinase smu1, partial [Gonapodya sp. JEL0774]